MGRFPHPECPDIEPSFSELIGLSVARGYTRLQWWVLNWNEPSIGFYRKLGAVPMDGIYWFDPKVMRERAAEQAKTGQEANGQEKSHEHSNR